MVTETWVAQVRTEMPKQSGSAKFPKGETVKLSKRFFEALWWVARVENRTAGEILEELAGVQIFARRKKYESTVAQLMKSDAAEAAVLARARGELAE